MLVCGVWCSLVCAFRKACSGHSFGNHPVEVFAVMCTAIQLSPVLPEGNDVLTARDAAPHPAGLETSLGDEVKGVDPSGAPLAALRTPLRSAP